jgi:hypothetical protein
MSVKKEHIVLLGSAGVGTAYATAKALRKNFNVKIVSADINPSYLVTTNLLSDFFELVQESVCEDFGNEMIEIIEKYQVDTYIPFVDKEVQKVAELYQSGKISSNISLQVKDPKIAEICNDKYLTYKWLSANNFPTPKTDLIENLSQLKNGFIVKPRSGFGSTIQKITDPSLIRIENPDKYLVQEQCHLPEVTIDVNYSKKYDSLRYVCRERIETKSGVCTKARLFQDPYLGEIALNLSKRLDLSSFCFQVMKLNNEFVITDINPRLGAGTAMSAAIGQDFFSAMFSNLWGENPEKYFAKFSEEKYVTRQYCEFIS